MLAFATRKNTAATGRPFKMLGSSDTNWRLIQPWGTPSSSHGQTYSASLVSD